MMATLSDTAEPLADAMPGFAFLGAAHIAAVGLSVAVPIVLSIAARRGGERTTTVICILFAVLLFGNEAIHWGYRLVTAGVDEFVRRHLPLHVCGIAVLALVVLLLLRKRTAFDVVYFWGLAGTANALLTPQLDVGFPAYRFFQYFIAHGGIVAGALFAVWGLRMRPTFGSLLRAYGLLALLLAVLLAVNPLLGSNYMFLREPPNAASPFFFAPWPYYIPILAAVGFALFCILLVPFEIAKRMGPQSAGAAEPPACGCGRRKPSRSP